MYDNCSQICRGGAELYRIVHYISFRNEFGLVKLCFLSLDVAERLYISRFSVSWHFMANYELHVVGASMWTPHVVGVSVWFTSLWQMDKFVAHYISHTGASFLVWFLYTNTFPVFLHWMCFAIGSTAIVYFSGYIFILWSSCRWSSFSFVLSSGKTLGLFLNVVTWRMCWVLEQIL